MNEKRKKVSALGQDYLKNLLARQNDELQAAVVLVKRNDRAKANSLLDASTMEWVTPE